MQNIAIIKQGTGRYLFSVPDNVALKEGDRVKCDTKRGITDGIAFADSAWVDENISQLIGKLTGAKFPLKSVVGRLEYLPFEKPQDKPAANPANKYDGMSNLQLKIEMCSRGACSAHNSERRKHDCLFADDGCNDVTDANRAEVIKYLLAEDAEADQKPEEKPTEDKPEPIKLYCVKDGLVMNFGENEFSKGDICTFDSAAGTVVLPNGGMLGCSPSPRSYDDWKRDNPFRSACLVPLVKRPAKVGEWVLLDRDDCFGKNKKGDIANVVDTPSYTTTFCFINDPTLEYGGGICACFGCDYTYVLDGYNPEPEAEPEPEYFSGKVVCVECPPNVGPYTPGKVYAFTNGFTHDDNGNKRPTPNSLHNPRSEGIRDFDDWQSHTFATFIEFKGESND